MFIAVVIWRWLIFIYSIGICNCFRSLIITIASFSKIISFLTFHLLLLRLNIVATTTTTIILGLNLKSLLWLSLLLSEGNFHGQRCLIILISSSIYSIIDILILHKCRSWCIFLNCTTLSCTISIFIHSRFQRGRGEALLESVERWLLVIVWRWRRGSECCLWGFIERMGLLLLFKVRDIVVVVVVVVINGSCWV